MNRDKQIEEMAKNVCHLDRTCDECMTSFECKAMMYAKRFYNAGYRKASEVAREIFEEIDAHFDQRIALYQTMKSRALLVGNEVERKYADTMIINLTIYKKEIAELKKKYTEEGK